MITSERAYFIARDWIDAWNRRDLNRVLNYYSDRIQHTSPMVVKFTRDMNCTIKGKKRLRQYFFAGMFRLNGTRFKLRDIMVGVDSISINL